MKRIASILLVTVFSLAGLSACGGSEPAKPGPYNDPDAQRDRAGEAQREMGRSRSY